MAKLLAIAVLAGAQILLGGQAASADVYQVGPTRTYRQLTQLPALAPGDVVEVDGGATYQGGVIFDDDGAPGNPIVIRGVGGRPHITGGFNSVEFRASHYVFDNFEISNAEFRGVYHHADDITIRNAVIHDCPNGLMGGDYDSGSLTLQYSEFYNNGAGSQDHQIYMATNERDYPGSVFRMEFCYVHDGLGGHNVKSRAERNEIYYNWIEGAWYHELELIGPDGETESIAREDSDVVGNVLRKTGGNRDFFVVRVGGDGTGQTWGRFRFVNNTILLAPDPWPSAVFRLFDGVESIEMHNNVIVQQEGAAETVRIFRDVEVEWASGAEVMTGSNNWIPNNSTDIPSGWSGTLMGDDPGFVDIDALDLRPVSGSPLVDAATTPLSPAGFAFPGALGRPTFLPPWATSMAAGAEQARPAGGTLDIGAFELGTGEPPPPDDPGTDPGDGGDDPTSDPGDDPGNGGDDPTTDPGGDNPGNDPGAPNPGGGEGANDVVGGCSAAGGGATAPWLLLVFALVLRLRPRARR